MAEVTVKHLVLMALDLLKDEGNDYWGEPDLVNFYNRSASAVVNVRPDANTVNAVIKLAAGASQTIPSRGNALMDVIRNMGIDGETPGVAITATDKQLLALYDPTWPQATQEAEVRNWASVSPRRFVVYPPNTGTGYVEIVMAENPPQINHDAGGLWEVALVGVEDQFVNAVFYHMMFLAHSKDGDLPGDENLTKHYYGLFAAACGIGGAPQQTAPA